MASNGSLHGPTVGPVVPSQCVDGAVPAGHHDPVLHIKHPRHAEEHGHTGQAHLQPDQNAGDYQQLGSWEWNIVLMK